VQNRAAFENREPKRRIRAPGSRAPTIVNPGGDLNELASHRSKPWKSLRMSLSGWPAAGIYGKKPLSREAD